jgi:hypothetical protein
MIEKEPKFKQGDKIYLRTDFYKFPEFKKYSRSMRKEIAGLLNEELTVNCPQKNNLLPKSGMFVMPNKFFTHFKPPVCIPAHIALAPSVITINIDAPEHITMAEYDSLVKQFKQTIDRLNKEYGNLYSAVAELEKRVVPENQPEKTEPITTYQGKQYREVKRRAKAGDLVKIVNRCSNSYENGSVFRIVKPEKPYDDEFGARYGNSLGQYLLDREYVVLEPIAEHPKKRTYTAEQIQEAKNIVLQHYDSTKYLVDSTNPNIIGAYFLNAKTKKYNCATATCSPNDTNDYHIGRMVACLKLHNKQLPEWVKGDSK